MNVIVEHRVGDETPLLKSSPLSEWTLVRIQLQPTISNAQITSQTEIEKFLHRLLGNELHVLVLLTCRYRRNTIRT